MDRQGQLASGAGTVAGRRTGAVEAGAIGTLADCAKAAPEIRTRLEDRMGLHGDGGALCCAGAEAPDYDEV